MDASLASFSFSLAAGEARHLHFSTGKTTPFRWLVWRETEMKTIPAFLFWKKRRRLVMISGLAVVASTMERRGGLCLFSCRVAAVVLACVEALWLLQKSLFRRHPTN